MRLLNPVLTRLGWVYVIVAPNLSSHEVIAYPMYFPDDHGSRQFRGLPYQKYLARLQNSRPWNQPYPPEKRLHRWAVRIPITEIVEEVDVMGIFRSWLKGEDPRKDVLLNILHKADIPLDSVGLGGSFSLGCQIPESDLDILIYGSRHVARCIRVLSNALLSGEAHLMSSDLAKQYARRYGKLYGLSVHHLNPIFAYDQTKLYVGGYKISFIFTYDESEQYQIPKCLFQRSAIGEVTLRARVVSSESSWSFPRKYCLETADGIRYHLWSYHWLHKAMTRSGMTVEVIANQVNKKNLVLTKLSHCIVPVHG